jgi:cell wall-associated NlpC family hydrolase
MSSGLVATMGLPAHAVTGVADAGGPQTASVPVLDAVPAVGALLTLPADLSSDAPVTASLAATVSFDRSAFKAVPNPPKPKPAPIPVVSTRASRSTTRTALTGTSSAARKSTTTTRKSTTPTGGGFGSARGSSVIAVASRYLGISYVYGGSSPSQGFDCSGLVMYVYRQLGVSLPRTAQQQYNATTHVSRSSARPGDLVFFGAPGGVYHVGIYLGGNMMLDAPHSGSVVQKRSIWSSNVAFGRP